MLAIQVATLPYYDVKFTIGTCKLLEPALSVSQYLNGIEAVSLQFREDVIAHKLMHVLADFSTPRIST